MKQGRRLRGHITFLEDGAYLLKKVNGKPTFYCNRFDDGHVHINDLAQSNLIHKKEWSIVL